MLIKCVKCGFENQLGSIFCRGCGEKIDMDQLSPEVMMEKSKENKANKAKKEMIKNIIALIIFGIFACLAAAVLVPQGQLKFEAAPTEAADSARQKLELVKAAAPGSTVSFTTDELSSLYSGIFALPFGDIEGKTFEPAALTFAEAENGELQVRMFCRVLTSFDVTLILNCMPSKAEGGTEPYNFDISFGKMGHLPFFFMQNIVASQFKPALSSEEIKNAFTQAKSVTWEASQLTFNF